MANFVMSAAFVSLFVAASVHAQTDETTTISWTYITCTNNCDNDTSTETTLPGENNPTTSSSVSIGSTIPGETSSSTEPNGTTGAGETSSSTEESSDTEITEGSSDNTGTTLREGASGSTSSPTEITGTDTASESSPGNTTQPGSNTSICTNSCELVKCQVVWGIIAVNLESTASRRLDLVSLGILTSTTGNLYQFKLLLTGQLDETQGASVRNQFTAYIQWALTSSDSIEVTAELAAAINSNASTREQIQLVISGSWSSVRNTAVSVSRFATWFQSFLLTASTTYSAEISALFSSQYDECFKGGSGDSWLSRHGGHHGLHKTRHNSAPVGALHHGRHQEKARHQGETQHHEAARHHGGLHDENRHHSGRHGEHHGKARHHGEHHEQQARHNGEHHSKARRHEEHHGKTRHHGGARHHGQSRHHGEAHLHGQTRHHGEHHAETRHNEEHHGKARHHVGLYGQNRHQAETRKRGEHHEQSRHHEGHHEASLHNGEARHHGEHNKEARHHGEHHAEARHQEVGHHQTRNHGYEVHEN